MSDGKDAIRVNELEKFLKDLTKKTDDFRKIYTTHSDGLKELRLLAKKTKEEFGKRVDKAVKKYENLYRQHNEHFEKLSQEAHASGDDDDIKEARDAWKNKVRCSEKCYEIKRAAMVLSELLDEQEEG